MRARLHSERIKFRPGAGQRRVKLQKKNPQISGLAVEEEFALLTYILGTNRYLSKFGTMFVLVANGDLPTDTLLPRKK